MEVTRLKTMIKNERTKIGETSFKYRYFKMITGIDTGYMEE